MAADLQTVAQLLDATLNSTQHKQGVFEDAHPQSAGMCEFVLLTSHS